MYDDSKALLELNAHGADPDAPCIRVRSTIGGILLAVALIAWCNPFMGAASDHVVSDGPFSSTSYVGFGYGSTKVYASAGQHIDLTCTAKVERGHLTVRVWRSGLVPRPPQESPLARLELHRSGTESAKVPIAESGLYRISISPWRDRGAYDIDYDISWRVK